MVRTTYGEHEQIIRYVRRSWGRSPIQQSLVLAWAKRVGRITVAPNKTIQRRFSISSTSVYPTSCLTISRLTVSSVARMQCEPPYPDSRIDQALASVPASLGGFPREPSVPISAAHEAAAFERKGRERARGCGCFQPGLSPKVEKSQLLEGDWPERL
ncbi:MAG: hypothetical protein JWL86_322 [Rhizobium sp.]|nr:hypothetical protein [Rhizobium sp.]